MKKQKVVCTKHFWVDYELGLTLLRCCLQVFLVLKCSKEVLKQQDNSSNNKESMYGVWKYSNK